MSLNLHKLDNKGIGHIIALVVVVLGVAVVGTYLLVASHADSIKLDSGNDQFITVKTFTKWPHNCGAGKPRSCSQPYVSSSPTSAFIQIRNTSRDSHTCSVDGVVYPGSIGGKNKRWINLTTPSASGTTVVRCPEGTYQFRMTHKKAFKVQLLGNTTQKALATATVCHHGYKFTDGTKNKPCEGKGGGDKGERSTILLGTTTPNK